MFVIGEISYRIKYSSRRSCLILILSQESGVVQVERYLGMKIIQIQQRIEQYDNEMILKAKTTDWLTLSHLSEVMLKAKRMMGKFHSW